MLEKQALIVFRHLVNCSPNSCFGLLFGVFRLSLPEPKIISIPYAGHHFNFMREGYLPLSVVPFIAPSNHTNSLDLPQKSTTCRLHGNFKASRKITPLAAAPFHFFFGLGNILTDFPVGGASTQLQRTCFGQLQHPCRTEVQSDHC